MLLAQDTAPGLTIGLHASPQVTTVSKTVAMGLHSPVLKNGAFPIVNGICTTPRGHIHPPLRMKGGSRLGPGPGPGPGLLRDAPCTRVAITGVVTAFDSITKVTRKTQICSHSMASSSLARPFLACYHSSTAPTHLSCSPQPVLLRGISGHPGLVTPHHPPSSSPFCFSSPPPSLLSHSLPPSLSPSRSPSSSPPHLQVTLASYGLTALEATCQMTGTCALIAATVKNYAA